MQACKAASKPGPAVDHDVHIPSYDLLNDQAGRLQQVFCRLLHPRRGLAFVRAGSGLWGFVNAAGANRCIYQSQCQDKGPDSTRVHSQSVVFCCRAAQDPFLIVSDNELSESMHNYRHLTNGQLTCVFWTLFLATGRRGRLSLDTGGNPLLFSGTS